MDRMIKRPPATVNMDVFGLAGRHHILVTDTTNKEDHMKNGLYLELADDDLYLHLKGPDDFDALLARLRQAGSEMDSDKFRQLMAVQIATLGPNASIADLASAIAAQGVPVPRGLTHNQEINNFIRQKQVGERKTEQELAARRRHPSYRM